MDAPNGEGFLLPGMTATVDFVIEEVNDVLLISNKAFSWTPPVEDMKILFEKMRGSRPGSGRGSQLGGFKMPEDIARIFYVDQEDNLGMAMFKKGVTDGIQTEIKKVIRGELIEGVKVITGIEKIKKNKEDNTAKNTLLPMPGRGRR